MDLNQALSFLQNLSIACKNQRDSATEYREQVLWDRHWMSALDSIEACRRLNELEKQGVETLEGNPPNKDWA